MFHSQDRLRKRRVNPKFHVLHLADSEPNVGFYEPQELPSPSSSSKNELIVNRLSTPRPSFFGSLPEVRLDDLVFSDFDEVDEFEEDATANHQVKDRPRLNVPVSQRTSQESGYDSATSSPNRRAPLRRQLALTVPCTCLSDSGTPCPLLSDEEEEEDEFPSRPRSLLSPSNHESKPHNVRPGSMESLSPLPWESLFDTLMHPASKVDIWQMRLAQTANEDRDEKIRSILQPLFNDECSLDAFQFQDQIISGSLPCPKEEAAYLASIQLCVEEQWPNNKRTQTIRRHLLKGQFGLSLL